MKCRVLYVLICVLVPFAISAQPTGHLEEYDISKDKVLYTIGYSHLDTQWNWDYPTTINMCLKNTMTENFYLFEKYPDYVFNFTGSRRYRMMKEYYPELYEKVKYYISKNRWFVSGSSVDEGEVNISSSESLIRQVLYGNKFFRDEFGVESVDYMLPDCFGFLANVPTIWNYCGLLGFSTQKLSWGSAIGIPFNVGVWLGPDDKGIISALNATNYTGGIDTRLDLDEGWNSRLEKNKEEHGISFDYRYYGIGDEGGAPRENDVKYLVESIGNEDQKFKVITTSSGQMFKDITPEIRQMLPTYKGDLLLVEHSAGSLTSEAYMKKMNRKNELMAKGAEQMAAIADLTGKIDYPFNKINNAWELVLGSQMHDILPGTSIPKAYEYAWNDEFIAANGFNDVLNSSVGTVTSFLDTRAKGRSVVVYNPVAHKREGIVKIKLKYEDLPEAVQVYDINGHPVITQEISRQDDVIEVLFAVQVPSVGLSVFDVRAIEKNLAFSSTLAVNDTSLENEFYKVTLANNGDIASIFDKKAGREILEKPARLEFLYEEPNNWPAWNMDWNDRQNPAIGYMSGNAKRRVIENGPARVAIEVTREGQNSTIKQVISLSAGEAGRVVEISNLVNWQSRGVSLKAAFPLTVSNPLATYNLGVGTIQRGNNHSRKFEVPSKQWFDLSAANGEYGVSILEDCKYGSDKPNDNTLRLTLLYTPKTHSRYPVQNSQDWGIHEFRYGIYGHEGTWQDSQTDWQAQYFNEPFLAYEVPQHEGQLGNQVSFITGNKEEIGLMAFKKMEEVDNYYLIRVNELYGHDVADGAITFPWGIVDAYEVNGQEEKIGGATFNGNQLAFDLTHNTIRSFAVKLLPPIKGIPLKQTSVTLPFNQDVMTFDNNRHDGEFAWRRALPAEMVPDVITSGGIRFEMGNRGDRHNNAVSCKGQEIQLPKGKYCSLHLLAASIYDAVGDFGVDGKIYSIPISSWNGFVGQYYNREFANDNVTVTNLADAFYKPDNIGWFSSHRHNGYPSGNEAYEYCYLYTYEIEIPNGAKTLTLPDNDHIKLFAVTLSDVHTNVKPLQQIIDDFYYNMKPKLTK